MELALNLGWIAVSVAIAWLATRDGCLATRQRATVIVTIALLSALLFPAISMSDDMHIDFVFMDDVRTHRHNVSPHHVTAVVMAVCAVLLDLSPRSIRATARTEQPQPCTLSGFMSAAGLRAPPAVLA